MGQLRASRKGSIREAAGLRFWDSRGFAWFLGGSDFSHGCCARLWAFSACLGWVFFSLNPHNPKR